MLESTAQQPWEINFGAEAPFALGVEEELLLVGPDHQLVDESARVLRQADPDDGDIDRELFKAMVESRSDVSAGAGDAIAALREVRREILDSGARIMGVGVHPCAETGEAEIARAPRYAISRTRCRASSGRRSAASTSTWACRTPRRRSARTTASGPISRW